MFVKEGREGSWELGLRSACYWDGMHDLVLESEGWGLRTGDVDEGESSLLVNWKYEEARRLRMLVSRLIDNGLQATLRK
jgi:hypothetical protein